MGLRVWSDRLDRRAQDNARRPYVAPLYFASALALALYGLLLAETPMVWLIFAAVWSVVAIASLVARARDRR